MMKVARPWIVVGAGRMGRMLLIWSQSRGVPVSLAWNCSEASAKITQDFAPSQTHCISGELGQSLKAALSERAAVVWLTVVDEAIEETASRLAGYIHRDSWVVHTSGVLQSGRLHQAGLEQPCASLHPLLAIADPREAFRRKANVTWTVEGDREPCDYLLRFLEDDGIHPLLIKSTAKPAYHAAAVMAANLLVGLIDAALTTAELADISSDNARTMLLPLAQSALHNLEQLPPGEALTGPIARGDASTILAHLKVLEEEEAPQELIEVYRALVKWTQRLASKPVL